MTELIHDVRRITLEQERRRGRAFLLAARVPKNLIGCHFDGLDVETWAHEQLIDIFVLGSRNFQVDVADFRRVTANQPIKLLCSRDDHHSSDGYCTPPIQVLRGVWSNWYHLGTDGIQAMNFQYSSEPTHGAGEPHWPIHQQALREMGDAEAIRWLDKTFVVARRGGGCGPQVVPNPEAWSTPRLFFSNTNMLAPLPATIDDGGKVDTFLTLEVGDDVNRASDKIDELRLRLLLSDPAASNLPPEQKIDRVFVREYMIPKRKARPNQKGTGPDYHWASPPAK